MHAFLSLSSQVFQQLPALLAVVEKFHHLFEGNCDQKADDDGGHMNEKASPRVHRLVWSMNIEHRTWCLFEVRHTPVWIFDDAPLRDHQVNIRRAGSELLHGLICLSEIPSVSGFCARKLNQ